MKKLLLLAIVLLSTVTKLVAQTPQLEPHWWMPNGVVNAVVKDPANNVVYIGGSFTFVGRNEPYGNKVSATTGLPDFNYLSPNGIVQCALPDGGGGWYIGGSFTDIGGTTRNRLAHINSDGTLDSWNPNANGTVFTMAMDFGELYIGGSFTTVGGQSRTRIAVLDLATGTPNTTLISTVNSTVNSIVVANGVVYAGGAFTSVTGGTRRRLAAWDQASGSLLSWDPNADTTVNVLTTDYAGTIYVGGLFTNVGGQARNRIAALDATTGLASTWNPNSNNTVNTLAYDFSGQLYVGGRFTNIGGSARNRASIINTTTGLATTWNPNCNNVVNTIQLSGGLAYLGGTFTTVGGQSRNRLAAVDATTGAIQPWNPNSNGVINVIAISGDDIYVGGNYSILNGVGATRNNIAALDVTTGELTSWNPNANGAVSAIAIDGTTVYIGGAFTTVGGQARQRLAAIDATSGAVSSWAPNADNTVNTIAVGGGVVYAGGLFKNVAGGIRNRIAAWDQSAGTLLSWNPNADTTVNTMVLDGTGNLYVGGIFTNIGGQARNRIAALSTATGLATSWNPSANNNVNALYLNGAGLIYAGGTFTNIGGLGRNRIAALNTSTGTATTWNPNANNAVNAIVLYSGVLYIGGSFSTIGGQSRVRIAGVNTTTGVVTTWNPGANNTVRALGASTTRLFIGGNFTLTQNTNPKYLAVYSDCSPSTPVLSSTASSICSNSSATLSLTGSLNGAADWSWYEGSCGGTLIGTGTSVVVSPNVNTTYYARGEGGCAVPPGYCSFISIAVTNPVVSDVDGTYTSLTENQLDGTTVVYADNSCNLIGAITDASGGNVLGNTTMTAVVSPTVTTSPSGYVYGRRFYTASPSSNGAATLTLYFTKDDFLHYNANSAGFLSLPSAGDNADPNKVYFRIATVVGGVHTISAPLGLSLNWNGTTNVWELTLPVTSISGATYYFTTMPTCSGISVSGLAATNVTPDAVTATWTSVITTPSWGWYGFRYRQVGSPTWIDAGTANNPATSRVITGLTAGTQYELQIRRHCSSQSEGPWSSSVIFTTLSSGCGSPMVFNTPTTTATSITVTWPIVSGVAWSEIEYKLASSGTWLPAGTVTSGVNTRTISGLTANSSYNIRGRSFCPSGTPSAWSAIANATTITATGCSLPPVVTASTVTGTSATITWPAVSGAAWYEFQYKQTSSGTWINGGTLGSTVTSKILSGLVSGTQYDFQARTFCPGGAASAWSSTLQFTTTGASGCETAPTLTASTVTGMTATITWPTVSGAAWFEFRYKQTSSGTWITAGTLVGSATSKQLTGLLQNTQYDFQARTYCSGGTTGSGWGSTLQFTTTGAASIAVIDGNQENQADQVSSSEKDVNLQSSLPEVKMYPNPTSNLIHVETQLESANSTLIVKVLDMSGRLVALTSKASVEGMNSLELSLIDLSNGMYTIELFNDAQLLNRSKVLKN